MRERLAFALLLCVFAVRISAETYGPISIVSRRALTPARSGHYHEYRFEISNRSNDRHVVTLRLGNDTPRGGRSTSTRTFQIAPQSTIVVAVPHLVTNWWTADHAVVTIDGRREDQVVRVTEEATYEPNPVTDVLLSRSVRFAEGAELPVSRPDIAPGDWSTNWLQYGRYAGIVVTPADWQELPPPVREAVLRWTFGGGTLVTLGAEPPLAGMTGEESRYGLGRIVVRADSDGSYDDPTVRPLLQKVAGATTLSGLAAQMPLLEGHTFPLRALFALLFLFAVIAGPVNLFVLARRNRRTWVFWSLPLLAIVASALLLGATFATEGFIRVQRGTAITYLEEESGQSVTLGLVGVYATVSPRGNVRFDASTELRPLQQQINSADTDWNDGQRLLGTWVGPRVPTYFAVRKVEPRRERLALRVAGGVADGVNGLGAHLEEVWFASESGELFTAKDIAPGRRFTLERVREAAPTDPSPVPRMFHVDNWAHLLGMIESNPAALLGRGTYIARLRETPFLERPLEKPTTSRQTGVVYGVVRREVSDAR